MRTIRILQEHVRISDPHITSDNAERLSMLGNVFEPLMRANEDGSFSACLADSWHLSEDARTWSFSIMEGKRFHDGSPVTTGDVVFSLCRMRDEDIPGELGTSGVIRGYLQGATIKSNGHNVTISTSVPMADLADLLSEIPILSEASVAALPDAFIGTGGFKISKVEDDQVVLESSETRLIWQAEPDPNVRFMAVQNGFADVAAKLATRHAQSNAVRIHRSATTVCATFMLNFDAKHAQNPYLRRAINLAVDVDSLVQDVMFGAADPLTGPLTQRHLGFDPAVPAWPFDPKAAQKELVRGKCLGADVVIDIPAILPDEAPLLAERVAAYLAAIGLNPSIRKDEDRPGYAMRVRNREIGTMACFDSSPGSTFRVFWEKFHSGFAGPWWLGYTNVAFDALVDRARSTSTLEARRTLYREAYALLRNDAPWLFLYSPQRLSAIGPELSDWSPSTGGLLLF